MRLRIERLAGPAAFEALAAEWSSLERDSRPRTPFTSPLWNTLWWKYLRASRPAVRDAFYSHAIYDEGGALRAVLPMMITHRPAVGPIRSRQLQFFGADPMITELRGPVCQADDLGEVTEAAIAYFDRHRRDWDWINWSGLSETPNPTRKFLRPSSIVEYYLQLPDDWRDFRSALPRNTKEALRHAYNALKRNTYQFKFTVLSNVDQLPLGLDRFFAMHTARARSPQGPRHQDLFRRRRARQFLTHYASEMARRGQLRLFQLEIGNEVVASRMGFVFEKQLYLYYSGFEPRWAKYNVMTTLMAETIQWAIGERFAVLNLSTGADQSKLRWRPAAREVWMATKIAPTARGRFAYFMHEELLLHQLGRLLPAGLAQWFGRR
jgi:CelD/BcsL family acetyltransferase involved in cellulose biosynthesis